MKGYLILLLTVLAGCYTRPLAVKQHGRAVATFPDIGAEWCAKTYPVKVDTILKGDTVLHLDTLYVGDYIEDQDTLTVRDTVIITKTIIKPVVINKTITRVDTIVKENTAKVDLCAIERRAAIMALEREQTLRAKWEKTAKRRWWINAGLIAGISLGLIFFIYRKIKKKVP